jgi:hypothetical protein
MNATAPHVLSAINAVRFAMAPSEGRLLIDLGDFDPSDCGRDGHGLWVPEKAIQHIKENPRRIFRPVAKWIMVT